MKRKSLFVLLAVVILYSGLYFYKLCLYYYYDSQQRFGEENQYILSAFYDRNNSFPDSPVQLREFISDNDSLFVENSTAEFLLKYDFHIKYEEEKGRMVVYEDGFNYRDDKLVDESTLSSINYFNFLFRRGDVVLFYTKIPLEKAVTIDKTFDLPKNVSMDFEDSSSPVD